MSDEKCPLCGAAVDRRRTNDKQAMRPQGTPEIDSLAVFRCGRNTVTNEDTLDCLRRQLATMQARAEAAELANAAVWDAHDEATCAEDLLNRMMHLNRASGNPGAPVLARLHKGEAAEGVLAAIDRLLSPGPELVGGFSVRRMLHAHPSCAIGMTVYRSGACIGVYEAPTLAAALQQAEGAVEKEKRI